METVVGSRSSVLQVFGEGRSPEVTSPPTDHGQPAAGYRVLIAAGGTGGHIFPALAVAETLRARSERTTLDLDPRPEVGQEQGREAEKQALAATLPQGSWQCRGQIEFLGTARGLESRVIPARGFTLHIVRAAGLKGIGSRRKVLNLLVLPLSAVETALVLKELQPDVVVGMGGYLAGPVMLEAALLGIPTLLIEPNAVPGLTNRILGPVVTMAAVGFEETARFYGSKARVTGHPVRQAFVEVSPKAHIAPFTVLIFGGSQGSAAINQCVIKSLPAFAAGTHRVKFIHQTGERDYNPVRDAYREHRIEAEVYPFIDNMPEAFARADLVIARAGASTVAELAAAGKAAVLIPFPVATDQHQRENARMLERVGAARVIGQAELTPARLANEIARLLCHPEGLALMEQAARSLARPEAAEGIADLIEKLAFSARP